MQIPRPHLVEAAPVRAGDVVLVRRIRWRIVQVRAYDECRVITLSGLGPPYLGVHRRVIVPFDRLEPIARPAHPRVVGARIWRRACRALIAGDNPPGSLRTARAAGLHPLPPPPAPGLGIGRGLWHRLPPGP